MREETIPLSLWITMCFLNFVWLSLLCNWFSICYIFENLWDWLYGFNGIFQWTFERRKCWKRRARILVVEEKRWYDKEVAGRWVEKEKIYFCLFRLIMISCCKRGMLAMFYLCDLILYLRGFKCDSLWELFLILLDFVYIVKRVMIKFFSGDFSRGDTRS